MHTLKVTIDGDVSSGTGPSHEIAKNIAAEHAIMGVVARRYFFLSLYKPPSLSLSLSLVLSLSFHPSLQIATL